jgi:hypothetical protein
MTGGASMRVLDTWMLLAAVHMSPFGTFETSIDVCYTAAFEGDPDIEPTSRQGRV